jgi:hypothetical protein
MIENNFCVYLRLSSDEYDFEEMIPRIEGYKYLYKKKGTSLAKYGNFKARANVFVIDCYNGTSIDDESNPLIISKLLPIIKTLSAIDVEDLKRELYIAGSIENQQFGFLIDLNFINLLAENKYMISFSGISYS